MNNRLDAVLNLISLTNNRESNYCSVCNKYIPPYKKVYSQNTCSRKCYEHLYYITKTKIKRKSK